MKLCLNLTENKASGRTRGQATKWAYADSYNLKAFEQVKGNWPAGQPLPIPAWCNTEHAKQTLHVDSVWQYEDIVAVIEGVLQQLLEDSNYDTVHNFRDMYAAFKASQMTSLQEFLRKYTPPVNRRNHM